jgi:uncharacterized protein (TIGR03435 family)
MPELARRLTEWLECPVVDRTRVSGSYDFKVVRDPDGIEAGSPVGVSDNIFQSIKQLGIELKKTTGTVYKLAVDQVSQPSSN